MNENMTKSPKEEALERAILKRLAGGPLFDTARLALCDEEIHAYQEYGNAVSIKRLAYNDHGPVHMRTVVLNAFTVAGLLDRAGVPLSLAREEGGSYEDSLTALFFAGMLHDIGMSVTRMGHEEYSVTLALPILNRFLELRYPGDIRRQVTVRALTCECICGHMGLVRIFSLEAGIILIADGADMAKGRARIPMMIATDAKVGDIHKYSSSAIEKIEIRAGVEKPVKISITMSSSVGFFQVEEVLFPKLNMSPVKPYIELEAGVIDEPMKKYL
ncbi:MAG: phosphohydrolase [Spirochaetales bacterium]|jgi:metal-dependent HD superfamily phosphatase/phosphodiesterase|nr:phosphohydrolase [Spirochaetales bacterium]